MSDQAHEAVVKFHLSLNVTDLARSIDFYRVFFGTEPAKRYDDYAKFELEDPPVIFSLAPHTPGPGGSLSHLGLRAATPELLAQMQDRLAAAGICSEDQHGTVCGYARQDKLWTRDPDGNFWEVYHLEEEIDPLSVRRSVEGPAARLEPTPGPVVWEHFVTHPLTGAIPHGEASMDEVRLTGTLNGSLDASAVADLAADAFRVLKPGARVVLHGLMSDRSLTGSRPELPGMAAMVSRVPARDEAVAVLLAAGFVGVQAVKLPDTPWFVHDGIGLREVKFAAWKPLSNPDGEPRQVLYKGPFTQAVADGGWSFDRGRRVTVPEAVWDQLRLGPSAEQFLFFEPDAGSACSVA